LSRSSAEISDQECRPPWPIASAAVADHAYGEQVNRMCVFCSTAFARFAARLHPQVSKPSVTDRDETPVALTSPVPTARTDKPGGQPAASVRAHPDVLKPSA
jgi:hypothetical protein